MKKTSIALFGLCLLILSCNKEDGATVSIHNPSSIDLSEKPVILSRTQLDPKASFPLLISEAGDTIASQLLDKDGDGEWDELFFVSDIDAGSTRELTLQWVKDKIDYVARTNIRFGRRDSEETPVYPVEVDTLTVRKLPGNLGYNIYQTDGPMFENDKVGFRHYFDGRNAKDMFGKKTPDISPETVGLDSTGGVFDNYHTMADWGRDVLSVGAASAGLGGIEIMLEDEEVIRLGTVVGDTVTNIQLSVFEVKNRGPVYSSFGIGHQNWTPKEDRSYKIQEQVAIWPGYYGYQNTVTVEGLQGDETLLVGLVNNNTPEDLQQVETDDWTILYTHDQQTYEREWWLGMALILPKDSYFGYGRAPEEGRFSTSFFGKIDLNKQPITYYAIGCWELSQDQGFEEESFFVDYITNLAKQLSVELKVEIRK